MTILEKEWPHCNAEQGKVEACQKGLSVMLLLQNCAEYQGLCHITVQSSAHIPT